MTEVLTSRKVYMSISELQDSKLKWEDTVWKWAQMGNMITPGVQEGVSKSQGDRYLQFYSVYGLQSG